MGFKSFVKSAGEKAMDVNLRTVVSGVAAIPEKAHEARVRRAANLLTEEYLKAMTTTDEPLVPITEEDKVFIGYDSSLGDDPAYESLD